MTPSNLIDYNIFFFFLLGSFSVYYFDSEENRTRVHTFLKYILLQSHKFYLGTSKEVLTIESLDKNKEPEEKLFAKVEIPYEEKYIDKYDCLVEIELDKEKLESLKNCIIMEKTPLGNVVMFYDADREIFKYYTDNTIPYRMLETVGRKYVCTYNCKTIYVDMKEVLKEAQEKMSQDDLLEKEKEKEKEMEEKERKEQKVTEEKNEPEKKNVFAKFKNYNDSSAKVPSKQTTSASQPQQQQPKPTNKRMILKERANHYICEGKISNYNIIKKVDRKVVDKKYSLTFADYKRLMQDSTKNA